MSATYTVGDGKTYSTIQAAIDAVPGDLSGQGVQTVAVYSDGGDDVYEERIDGKAGFSNSSASDYIRLTSMQAHGGKAREAGGTGIRINAPGGAYHAAVDLVEWSRIDGFEVTMTQTNNSYHAGGVQVWGNGTICENIVHAVRNNGTNNKQARGIVVIYDGCKIYNNVVYDIYSKGADLGCGIRIYGSNSGNQGYICNNTVCGCDADTYANNGCFWAASANETANYIVRNNYAGDVRGGANKKDFWFNNGDPEDCSNNISSDGSSDDYGGSDNQVNKAAADQFKGMGSGSEDFHLKEGSDCLGAGQDLSALFTTDVDGGERVNWDAGADEYVSFERAPGGGHWPFSVYANARTVLYPLGT